MPEYSKRLKNHLMLHLVDSMLQFGPTSCFNTERLVTVVCLDAVIINIDSKHSILLYVLKMCLVIVKHPVKILPIALLPSSNYDTLYLEDAVVIQMKGKLVFINSYMYTFTLML